MINTKPQTIKVHKVSAKLGLDVTLPSASATLSDWCYIPGGTFTRDSLIEILASSYSTGNPGTNVTLSCYINTKLSLTGATMIATYLVNGPSQSLYRMLSFSTTGLRTTSIDLNDYSSTVGTVPFNISSGYYFMFTISAAAGTTTVRVNSYRIVEYL